MHKDSNTMESKMKIFATFLFFILITPRAEGTNDNQRLVDSLTTEGSKLSTGIENLANQCVGKGQNVDVLNTVQHSLDLQVKTSHYNPLCEEEIIILAPSFSVRAPSFKP